MEAQPVVRAREDAHAHLGREVEAPRIGVLLDRIVVGGHLGVAGADFRAHVGLEDALGQEDVAARNTERQLEERVLLGGRQRRVARRVDGLARDGLQVGLVVDEQTHGHARAEVVAALEVHAPPRGLVGEEAAAHGEVALPVDVHVGVGEELRLARQRQYEEPGCEQQEFYGFHGLMRFLDGYCAR